MPELKEGTKYDQDKLRYDLIPVRPLEKVAWVYTIGAKKYEDRNWEKGIKYGRIFGAMMRHGWAWWRGEKNDPTDGQHHLASVVWCAMALMEYEDTKPEYDDRTKYLQKTIHIIKIGTLDNPATPSQIEEIKKKFHNISDKAEGSCDLCNCSGFELFDIEIIYPNNGLNNVPKQEKYKTCEGCYKRVLNAEQNNKTKCCINTHA